MKKTKSPKRGKTLIKCKRGTCKKLFNQRENDRFHRKVMRYTPKAINKIKGYCDASCELLHRDELAQCCPPCTEEDKHPSDAKLFQQAYDIYWSIKNVVYNRGPKASLKLIEEVNKVIEKYKKKK